MAKMSTGIVLGKFMPLHQGHELLLRFATHYVDQLFIVVDNLADAVMEGPLRVQWIKQSFPQATVLYLPHPMPQYPEEHPDFWTFWQTTLLTLLPEKPDYLFASEAYGTQLAEALNATFVPFDLQRESVPISASLIRENPWDHWDYLSAAAKPFYLKRICIFGPESSGKSTLAQSLAMHFNTSWAPEYARRFIENKKTIVLEDMLTIAKGQIALEKSMQTQANKILFSDTCALSTSLWSDWLFKSCSFELNQLAEHQVHDFYLLMTPDLPWIADPVRYLPEQSLQFFKDCEDLLKRKSLPYAVVSGQGSERLAQAIALLKAYFPRLK